MRIFVKAKPGVKKDSIEKIDALHFKVSVKARAEDGKANMAIGELLAEYFGVPKSGVRIIRGHQGRQKIVEVDV